MTTYHLYLAIGKPGTVDSSQDRTSEYTDIDQAIAAFRKAAEDGREYACLELLRDAPEVRS